MRSTRIKHRNRLLAAALDAALDAARRYRLDEPRDDSHADPDSHHTRPPAAQDGPRTATDTRSHMDSHPDNATLHYAELTPAERHQIGTAIHTAARIPIDGRQLTDNEREALALIEAASHTMTAAQLDAIAAETDDPDAIEARRRADDMCHDCGRLHDGDCQQEQVP